jgi:uncharacterized cupredoxin-like copper-binding protein
MTRFSSGAFWISVLLFPAPSEAAARQQDVDSPVEVRLSEWKIEMPGSLPAGSTRFKVVNAGTKKHTFKIEGPGIEKKLAKDLKAGETGELSVDLKPGTYHVNCPIGFGAHKRKGMASTLTVTENPKSAR